MQALKSSKSMDLILCKLKNAQKHEFNFFARSKRSKDMNLIFESLRKLKKQGFNFFATLNYARFVAKGLIIVIGISIS